MKKGSYTIQEGFDGSGVKGGGVGAVSTRAPDNSYSTCLLALLFFLALCIVIMLAAWPWGHDKTSTPQHTENGDRGEHDALSGGKITESPTYGKPTFTTTKRDRHHHHTDIDTTTEITTSSHSEAGVHPEGETSHEDDGDGHTTVKASKKAPAKSGHTHHSDKSHTEHAKIGPSEHQNASEWIESGKKAAKNKTMERIEVLPTDSVLPMSTTVADKSEVADPEKGSSQSVPLVVSTLTPDISATKLPMLNVDHPEPGGISTTTEPLKPKQSATDSSLLHHDGHVEVTVTPMNAGPITSTSISSSNVSNIVTVSDTEGSDVSSKKEIVGSSQSVLSGVSTLTPDQSATKWPMLNVDHPEPGGISTTIEPLKPKQSATDSSLLHHDGHVEVTVTPTNAGPIISTSPSSSNVSNIVTVSDTEGSGASSKRETVTPTPTSLDLLLKDLKVVEIDKPTEKQTTETCNSPSCKALSSHLLALMNHSADPCQDFYNYACGGIQGENSRWISEVDPSSEAWSRISGMMHHINPDSPISHQKFKSFYESCVFYDQHVQRSDSLKKGREIIASVGEFHSANTWVDGTLTSVIGELLNHHFSPLFDLLLDVDSDNSSKFAIKLVPPVFKSPFGYSNGNEQTVLRGWSNETCKQVASANRVEVDFNERYTIYEDCLGNYQSYLNEVNEALEILKPIMNLNENETSKIVAESEVYLDLVLGNILQTILPNPGMRRKILLGKVFEKYTITELKDHFPLIDWSLLIKMLLGYEIPDTTVVQVYFPSYFFSFFEKLTEQHITERNVANTLMTMFTHEVYFGLVMHRETCNRENYCLNVARGLMEDVSSALFLKSFKPEQLSKFQLMINEIFQELILSLKSEISKVSWLDSDSQISILEKIRHMKLFADGGVSIYLNDTYLDSQLHELAINSTYIDNAVSLLKWYRKKMYSVYQKNPSDIEQIWSHFLLPYDSLGKVIYGLNAIVVPYGMMSKPYFSEEYPSYVKMANLGHMIAHEIWHHFDLSGIHYESDGVRGNLLTNASMAKMEILKKCATDQYSTKRFSLAADGKGFEYKLDPAISLNERLADFGATHLTYSTLWGSGRASGDPALPWVLKTPKQLFFLFLAQNFCSKSSEYDYMVSMFEKEHLPPFIRINDIAFNSRDFADAFSCSAVSSPQCYPFNV